MDYRIVPMEEKHIPAVAELERVCFVHPWTEENLREELTNGNSRFLVAEGEGVLGYAGVQEICGEAYVTNIAVFPGSRRAGIGLALTEAACRGARERNCEFITLEVRESNFPAISMYEKLGFVPTGRRRNFYTEPAEDALLYTKYFTREKDENSCD